MTMFPAALSGFRLLASGSAWRLGSRLLAGNAQGYEWVMGFGRTAALTTLCICQHRRKRWRQAFFGRLRRTTFGFRLLGLAAGTVNRGGYTGGRLLGDGFRRLGVGASALCVHATRLCVCGRILGLHPGRPRRRLPADAIQKQRVSPERLLLFASPRHQRRFYLQRLLLFTLPPALLFRRLLRSTLFQPRLLPLVRLSPSGYDS